MAVREEPDEQPLDHVLLPDDDFAHLHLKEVDKCAFTLDAFAKFLDVCHWFLVLGSWLLVPGSWFLVLGSWFVTARRPVRGSFSVGGRMQARFLAWPDFSSIFNF